MNFPEISLESLNLQQLIKLFERNDWDGVAAILLTALNRLKQAGAEFAAILANTPHNAYDRIRDASPLEILDHALGRLPGSHAIEHPAAV